VSFFLLILSDSRGVDRGDTLNPVCSETGRRYTGLVSGWLLDFLQSREQHVAALHLPTVLETNNVEFPDVPETEAILSIKSRAVLTAESFVAHLRRKKVAALLAS
jgi:hypothetical protein